MKRKALATILINTYREPTELFVDGEVLFSRERTTQGDPLAMAMYAIATVPLINKLKENVTQIWYADDATEQSTEMVGQDLLTMSFLWLLPKCCNNLACHKEGPSSSC